MARYVVDAATAIQLARSEASVGAAHQLLAPTLLRSQTLSAMHEAVAHGEVTADEARECLERIAKMGIRLLGDAGRRTITRTVRLVCARRCRSTWLGLHRLDTAEPGRRSDFLDRVDEELRAIR